MDPFVGLKCQLAFHSATCLGGCLPHTLLHKTDLIPDRDRPIHIFEEDLKLCMKRGMRSHPRWDPWEFCWEKAPKSSKNRDVIRHVASVCGFPNHRARGREISNDNRGIGNIETVKTADVNKLPIHSLSTSGIRLVYLSPSGKVMRERVMAISVPRTPPRPITTLPPILLQREVEIAPNQKHGIPRSTKRLPNTL